MSVRIKWRARTALVLPLFLLAGAACRANAAAPAGVVDSAARTSTGSDHEIVHFPGDAPSVHVHPGYTVIDLNEGYCGTDIASAEARRNLEAYLAARRSGRLPAALAAKSGSPPVVGQEQSFNVSENNTWSPLDFRLVDIQEGSYHLWVEIAELKNGNVTPSEIESLKDVLLDQTPSASIDPSKGILENDRDIFGDAPDVNGDGVVDLLMYDIGRGSGNTLGYVSMTDLNPDAPEGDGNGRDILYLDSAEGTSNLSAMAAIAAHEYTHLIHAAYGWDETFITEGYAEYAMVMNGYFWRAINYQTDPTELALPLFTARITSGSMDEKDYQRGGLFFTYVAEQTRPRAIGHMLKGPVVKGANGIDSVLVKEEDTSLAAMVLGFHSANRFNDRSLGPDFGYEAPQRASLQAASLARKTFDGEQEYSTSGETPYAFDFSEDAVFNIAGGAVKYFRFADVADIQIDYDTPGSPAFPPELIEEQRRRNRLRLVLEPENGGPRVVRDLQPEIGPQYVDGVYSAVTLMLVNTDPGVAAGKDGIDLRVVWTPASQAVSADAAPELPATAELGQNYPNPFNPSTTVPVRLDHTAHVRLEVFDLLGRRVDLLADRTLSAGEHLFALDAGSWPSGTYLVRMQTDDVVRTRRMMLVK